MAQWKKGSATLYFQARKYFFWLRWIENALQIEAVNKGELTKCYRGELKADEKLLNEIYQFLQIHSYRQSLSNKRVDQISLILTIINRTEERKGYQCRLIFNDSIKSINVQPVQVSQTYFLTKKIQALQYQKKNDRMMMAQFGTELSRKIEQKDEDIKKSLAEQMQGMISALANQIQQKLDVAKRKRESEDGTTGDLNLKKIEKKLRKKIKKQLKQRKKQKKHKKIEKKKKRKERRKQKRRLQELLGAQNQNEQPVPNQIEIPQESTQSLPKPLINNLQNFPFHQQDPNNFLNVDLIDVNEAAAVSDEPRQSSKKKKKKQKHKYKHERTEEKHLVVQPIVTTVSHMGKLRNRAGDLTIPIRKIQPIQVIDDKKEKGEKKSKQKKHKKEKKKGKDDQDQQLQQIQQAGQKQYYKRLQQIRKTDDINKARLARINRLKPMLAIPKQPLTQVDQFNPKYNGQPKYKPFVSINDYQAIRPNEVFVRRIEQNNTECKKIPAIFRQDIPSFSNFEVSGSVVRKMSGNQYKQMVFDYVVPQTGKHVITMRLIQSKRFYLWFGVVDLRQKDRQQSFNKKNCITFSFRTGHVATSNKWSKSTIGRMNIGLSVRMQIDKDKNSIVWYVSDGRNSIAPIPKLMQRLNLVPYFEIMDAGDEVCFQE